MNRFKNLFGFFAFSLVLLGLPALASAQWQGNNRNGGYGNSNHGNLRSTVKDLKKQAAGFEKQLNRALDNNRHNDRSQENNLNDLAKQFKNAAADLEAKYGNDRDFNKSGDKARRVLDLGYQLQNILRTSRIAGNLEYDWTPIGQDLDTLANAYNYNNSNNGRNNRNNRSGNWRNNFPFPLPF